MKQLAQEFFYVKMGNPNMSFRNLKLEHKLTKKKYKGKIFLLDDSFSSIQIYFFNKLDHPFILSHYGCFSCEGRKAIVYQNYVSSTDVFMDRTLVGDQVLEAIGQICSAMVYLMEERVNYTINQQKIVNLKKNQETIFKLTGMGCNGSPEVDRNNCRNLIQLVNRITGSLHDKLLSSVLQCFKDKEIQQFKEAFQEACKLSQVLRKYKSVPVPIVLNSQQILNLILFTFKDLYGQFKQILSEEQRGRVVNLLKLSASKITKRLEDNRRRVSSLLQEQINILLAHSQGIQSQNLDYRKIVHRLTSFEFSFKSFFESSRRHDLALRIILIKYSIKFILSWNIKKLSDFAGCKEQTLIGGYKHLLQNKSDIMELKKFIKNLDA